MIKKIKQKILNFINYKIFNPNRSIFKLFNKYELAQGSIVIDIGAHDGTISEFFLKKGCKVFAFEPNKFLYEKLKKKKIKYPNFECFNLGVNSTKGSFNLYLKKGAKNSSNYFSQSSSLLSDKFNVSKNKFIRVDCITFDEVFKITGNVKLVKIDIEGAEYKIYKQLVKNSNKFENCLMECHYSKLPLTYKKRHEQMVKYINSHVNRNKFNLDYL